MEDSAWFLQHKNTLRWVILASLIIAMLGPWFFDRVYVPPKFTCSAPNIRMDGDFCGVPLSGVQFFRFSMEGFFYMLLEVRRGTLAGRSRELLAGLSIFPLLPFFTTLFSIWRKETRRLRMFSLVAWILAWLPTLVLFLFQIKYQSLRLWGLWLYILLAISAITIEFLVLKK